MPVYGIREKKNEIMGLLRHAKRSADDVLLPLQGTRLLQHVCNILFVYFGMMLSGYTHIVYQQWNVPISAHVQERIFQNNNTFINGSSFFLHDYRHAVFSLCEQHYLHSSNYDKMTYSLQCNGTDMLREVYLNVTNEMINFWRVYQVQGNDGIVLTVFFSILLTPCVLFMSTDSVNHMVLDMSNFIYTFLHVF